MFGCFTRLLNTDIFSLKQRLVLAVVVVDIFLAVFITISLYRRLQQLELWSEVRTQNIAQVLEDGLAGHIGRIDIALLSIKDHIEEHLLQGPAQPDEWNRHILRYFQHVPHLHSIRATDADGHVLYGTEVTSGVNIADRDYFQELRADSSERLVFTKPVISKTSGVAVLNLARRLNFKDGSFAGIVYGQMAIDDLAGFFASLNLGRHGSIALRSLDYTLIARYPPLTFTSEVEQKRVSEKLQQLLAADERSGTYRAHYPGDNIERIFTFHLVGSYPLFVNVGLATSNHLDLWRKEVYINLVLVGCFIIGSIIFSSLLMRRYKSEKRAWDELKKVSDAQEHLITARTAEINTVNTQLQRELKEKVKIEEMLRSSLAEKEILIKEVHHRVKNNMEIISSLLMLQADRHAIPGLKMLLADSQQRIKSMALVHEKLYQARNLACIDFAEYVTSLVNDLVALYHQVGQVIGTSIDIAEVMLDIDTAIPCGLIINELVSNALKYAFPEVASGNIVIRLTREQGGFCLCIEDDGVGLPDGYTLQKATTLGHQLVQALVGQIGGTLSCSSGKNGRGARFTIAFPERQGRTL